MSTIKDIYKNILNERGIEWEEGKHTEALILNADEVIKSPVSYTHLVGNCVILHLEQYNKV